jgi:hypothetical protein
MTWANGQIGDLLPVSLEEQLACVRRELRLRRRVYERRIHTHRMTEEQAAREMRAMLAVEATLEALAQKERLL